MTHFFAKLPNSIPVDRYLSGLIKKELLSKMIIDTNTNHSKEEALYEV